MTKDEALKLALEHIEGNYTVSAEDAITAIKEALEQPERYPDTLISYNCTCGKTMKFESVNGIVAPQREWVGLTRDEQSFVYDTLKNSTSRKDSFWVDFANAIEKTLKEKNT